MQYGRRNMWDKVKMNRSWSIPSPGRETVQWIIILRSTYNSDCWAHCNGGEDKERDPKSETRASTLCVCFSCLWIDIHNDCLLVAIPLRVALVSFLSCRWWSVWDDENAVIAWAAVAHCSRLDRGGKSWPQRIDFSPEDVCTYKYSGQDKMTTLRG